MNEKLLQKDKEGSLINLMSHETKHNSAHNISRIEGKFMSNVKDASVQSTLK